ncbi:MAG TPA: acyltransferase [Candidatus Baltobacteraceae bacterium]|nr:acyltransferase [Candidatus Baltobacteraceae bacterium]
MAQTRLGVLDGLRGIAVLLVLWYHVWEITWLGAPLPSLQFVPETGFAGVDLFFFISGFVIVYPFVKALAAGDVPPTWGSFAYRRALKIVPSYVLSIAIAIAVGYAAFASPGEAAADIGTHLLFIHTWFESTAGSINGVLWTLAVEVQFYAIFPLVWLAFRRVPYVTAAVMIAAALAFRSWGASCCLHTHALLMYENLPSFLDTFAFGMLAAHLYVRYRERLRSARDKSAATAIAFAGFALLAYLLHGLWDVRVLPDWPTAWETLHRTLIGVSFFMMGLGSLLAFGWWQRTLANPVLLFCAVISYNLYLYHQMVARLLLKWRIPPFTGPSEHYDPHWQAAYTWIAFAAAIAFATLVTYAFERPLLRVRPAQLAQLAAKLRGRRALPPA